MLDFFNEILSCFGIFINFLFFYTLSGIPVGYIILSCIVFMVIVDYILGSVR